MCKEVKLTITKQYVQNVHPIWASEDDRLVKRHTKHK